MTQTLNPTRSLLVQIRVDISGPAKKPQAKGKPSSKFFLFSLVVFATLIALGTAAIVRDPASFALVAIVWNEIKPVLVLLLQFLLK